MSGHWVTPDGVIRYLIPPEAADMSIPVRCNYCHKIYDLGMVQVVQRYADCSVFKTPCCNRQADDRQWKSSPDYTPLPH
jgi:hypothetical protein